MKKFDDLMSVKNEIENELKTACLEIEHISHRLGYSYTVICRKGKNENT